MSGVRTKLGGKKRRGTIPNATRGAQKEWPEWERCHPAKRDRDRIESFERVHVNVSTRIAWVVLMDADNIRWSHIDYVDIADDGLFGGRAPVLVIATDRGLTLRFFKIGAPSRMKSPEEMRHFIISREWELTAPWSMPWSPRGSRSQLTDTVPPSLPNMQRYLQ
ncbi:uncharacterized protein EI90DRAFT_3293551 [Cantharellus anzutake]|uniref:uncharacterized protein n=1 Tax=Cantharellus anzutake TaxID=1750568 RepID=UPI001906EB48|nr:uncharacterized protein EI90DRAFT_3293551 [Cantharellus anzutake]KAF8316991.1 hypothetical protein EI90DRAFT_3293551 [Cantharellus anzutake]